MPDLRADQDAALVARVRAGDRSAYRTLVAAHLPRVRRVCRGLVDAASADDIAQEALLRAWARLHALEQPGRFGPWLLSIARHACYDHHRRQRPVVALEADAEPAPSATPLERAEQDERAARVREAVHGLPEIYREVIELFHFAQAGYAEIAEVLGISVAGVNQRLTRGRKLLRARLGARTHEEDEA